MGRKKRDAEASVCEPPPPESESLGLEGEDSPPVVPAQVAGRSRIPVLDVSVTVSSGGGRGASGESDTLEVTALTDEAYPAEEELGHVSSVAQSDEELSEVSWAQSLRWEVIRRRSGPAGLGRSHSRVPNEKVRVRRNAHDRGEEMLRSRVRISDDFPVAAPVARRFRRGSAAEPLCMFRSCLLT